MNKIKKEYTSKEVCEILNISRSTLQRWLRKDKSLEPQRKDTGLTDMRIFQENDLKNLVKYRDKFKRK